jgi:hypothetical protein
MRGIALALLWTNLYGYAWCADYYLSAKGNDADRGTEQRPWKTLQRVNRQDFRPGDRLLFEGGSTFTGTLELNERDSGAAGQLLIVTSYGQGRALLNGGTSRAISSLGCRYVTFRNLALRGAGRKGGNTDSGLYLAGGSDVEVDGLDVSGFRKSGVEIDGVDRARIFRVHAHENGFAGISSGGRPSSDLYIGYSLAENNPGDPTIHDNHSGNGIVVGSVRGAVIEYSEARYNGWDMVWTGNGPVGIWAYQSDRVTIQFCISHHNRSTAEDGGGFDLDGGMTNSVVQYNYSHDNFGTGYLICQYEGAGEFANNVVRYNISQDDGLLAHNSGIYVWVGGSGMKSTLVHNNTIFNTKGSAVAFGYASGYAADRPKMEFYNNIFVSRLAQIRGGAERGRFAGNLYWAMGDRGFEVDGYKDFEAWTRATGQELDNGHLVGMSADPRLRKDGAGLIMNPEELATLHEYNLLPNSPALGTGVDLRACFGLDPGGRDFFGSPLPVGARPAIGACQCVSAPYPRRTEGSRRPSATPAAQAESH